MRYNYLSSALKVLLVLTTCYAWAAYAQTDLNFSDFPSSGDWGGGGYDRYTPNPNGPQNPNGPWQPTPYCPQLPCDPPPPPPCDPRNCDPFPDGRGDWIEPYDPDLDPYANPGFDPGIIPTPTVDQPVQPALPGENKPILPTELTPVRSCSESMKELREFLNSPDANVRQSRAAKVLVLRLRLTCPDLGL